MKPLPQLRLIALLGAVTIANLIPAEGVTTLSGMEIKGRIVSEDADQVMLETEYGQLRFLKIRLKSITRGAGAPAPSAPPDAPPPGPAPFGGFAEPIGGPEPPAGGNPFGIPGGNPFGAPGGIPGGNPFGGPDPGAPNPFGGGGIFGDPMASAPRETQPPAAEPTPTPTPQKPRFMTPARSSDPVVPENAAGVVFGVGPEGPGFWRLQGSPDWLAAVEDTPFAGNMELQSRDTPTMRFLLGPANDEVRLAQETQIALTRWDLGEKNPELSLARGAAWIKAGTRTEGDLSIQTTELTATTTDALMLVDRSVSATRVSVSTGKVKIESKGTGVRADLAAGQSVIVTVSGQVLEVTTPPVDLAAAWEDWDGTSLEMLRPTPSLQAAVEASNAAWEAEMLGYAPSEDVQKTDNAGALGELKYQERLNSYADAFLRLAADTGMVPTTEQGWSALRFDPGVPGWKGPYLNGAVPPLDPWRQPLRYRALESRSGNQFGRVYSIWQDGRDQGGDNASVDRVALIMYFNLERLKNPPAN